MYTIRLALRYAFSRYNRHRGRSVRMALGFLFSLCVFLCVISVMEALQVGQFAAVKQVRSFPLVVKGDDEEGVRALVGDDIPLFGYASAPALLTTSEGESLAVMVRFVDNTYTGGLQIGMGTLGTDTLFPVSLYQSLRSGSYSLSLLEEGKRLTKVLRKREIVPGGYYVTRLGSAFDDQTIFMPLSEAPASAPRQIGILSDDEDEAGLSSALRSEGYEVLPWQEAESSLYGAMLLEKLMMIAVLCLLFIIILVQGATDARLFVHAKRREIGSLSLLGLRKHHIALIFALSGAWVSLVGLCGGMILGTCILRFAPSALGLEGFFTLHFPLSLAFLMSLAMEVLVFLLFYHEALKCERFSIMENVYGN